MNKLVSPFFYLIAIFALGMALKSSRAVAEPMVAADEGPVRVVIYTEDCALTSVVKNLPKRATWTENGKTFEGCAAVIQQAGLVIFYFDDKTVALMPAQMFQRVSNT